MKRKLLSFAIAFALLAQTVVFSATGDLTGIIASVFSTSGGHTTRTIDAKVTSKAKGASTGGDFVTGYVTDANFDYAASIDMSGIVANFNSLYDEAKKDVAGYFSDFEASNITGTFTITFKDVKGSITGTVPTTGELNSQFPSGSLFSVTGVDDSTSGTVKVTVVSAPVTVAALKADIDGANKYLADIEMIKTGLTASEQNSVITVALNGTVNIAETGYAPFAVLTFKGNDSITTYYYGGGGGGGSSSTTTTPSSGTTTSTNGESTTQSTTTTSGNTSTTTSTTTNSDGSTSSTSSKTTTSGNTSTTNSKTEEKAADGTKTTTESESKTTQNSDGSKTTVENESTTVENPDGTKTNIEKQKETEEKKITDDEGNEIKQTITEETIVETTETSDNPDEPAPAPTTSYRKTIVEETADGTVTVEITTTDSSDDENAKEYTVKTTTEKPAESDASVGVTTSHATKTVTVVENKPNDEKPGFIGLGWSTSPFAPADIDYDGTSVLTEEVPVEIVTTVTEITDENGNVTYETTIEETTETIAKHQQYAYMEIPEAFENTTTEDGLFVHKPYINGYPDGEVKPTNNMTREEVATAFVNILNDTFKETYATTEQDFPDVESSRWSNNPIATLTNAGILVGDDAGNFNPAKPITRAEFATIAAKFVPDAAPATNYFTDIDGHWAQDSILKVFGLGWTKGRGDGTFDPDAPITRAEVMQIINTMWTRFAKYDKSENSWSDLSTEAWYYDTVMDATTENTFTRSANGVREVRVTD